MNLLSLRVLFVLISLGHEAQAITNGGASSMKSNRTASSGTGITKEMTYSQNSLCRQNYCINPIFPGLNDLPRLEKLEWQCATSAMVTDYLDFCGGAIQYNPALPSPVSKATPVDELVKAQDDAAMTMFFYHLSGMGYDAWDYQEPKNSDNSCVRTIWKMVCYTYFPRAAAGCKEGEQSEYKRPCQSSCQNYIMQCGVECCDESVSCVFAHTSYDNTGKLQLLQTGYVDALGPSASCTGSARRMVSSPFVLLMVIFGLHVAAGSCSQEQGAGRKTRAAPELKRAGLGASRWALFGICAVLALALQGCDVTIPKHTVGNWRTKEDYLMQYKYVPPGKPLSKAVLNSCSVPDLPPTEQCSGKGFCRSFSTSSVHAQNLKPLAFCQCDRNYADPECSTKRKSQTIAFLWSLFLGMFGADYFYLGFPLWGVGKLLTLGGFGFWWLVDIVRTGAGPVYAYNFRTSQDLPHWAAVLTMITICMCCGFFVAIEGYLTYRRQKRQDLAALSNKEEERHLKNTEAQMVDEMDGPRYRVHGPHTFKHRMGFSGYGAMLPVPHPNAAVAKAEFQGKQGHYPYAGPHGPYNSGGFDATGEPAKTQSEYPILSFHK
mmetsp:Transcript_21240/g.39345  ORF Transcript_21240/g.39345 Transcript_21240/m.39345 type:complete len:603 (+) Transcript_21240:112-1920(+)